MDKDRCFGKFILIKIEIYGILIWLWRDKNGAGIDIYLISS